MTQAHQGGLGNSDALPNHHAVLIGINAYKEKPLKGSVRDVQAIQKYLYENIKAPLKMEMLAADGKVSPDPTKPPLNPANKPTYTNVVIALEKIIKRAKPGDYVYIHFSGHGTKESPSSEFSDRSTGDLALVLLDAEDDTRTRYLRGPRLALLLKAMADNGLRVTLVLDCCFSASVYRANNLNTRFLPYPAAFASAKSSEAERSLTAKIKQAGNRDVSMLPNWLVSPDRYTILAACGPDEDAREPSFNGEKYGALTYCLLRSLEACHGLRRRHKDIFDYLRVTFLRFNIRSQNPILYGNANLGFFGSVNFSSEPASTPIIVDKAGYIELHAGRAHGVAIGDVFCLHPFSPATPESPEHETVINVGITSTRAFTSIGQLIDKTLTCPRTGALATIHRSHMLRKMHIVVDESVRHHYDWSENSQDSLLDFQPDNDSNTSAFHLTSNSGQYVVLDGARHAINYLPPLPLDSTDMNQVCSIIEQLARYKLVNELANDAVEQTYADSFTIQVTNNSGDVLHPESWFEVPHNESTKLTLKLVNKGHKKLYVHIYNLGPRWEISNIYRATYQALPPRKIADGLTGEMQKILKLVVPAELRDSRQDCCEDIVKVFVTSEPTSFSLLELPKIGGMASTRSVATDMYRGDEPATEDWATFNYQIRKSLK